MSPDGNPYPDLVRTYVFRIGEYLNNAYIALGQDETEKASELLWGSMALAVKAVAAVREIELRNHGSIWDFARQLSLELGDLALFDSFRDAHRLHVNFYESDLTREMVLDSEERVRRGVAKLLERIPREAMEP